MFQKTAKLCRKLDRSVYTDHSETEERWDQTVGRSHPGCVANIKVQ